jgi:hypothetical protein
MIRRSYPRRSLLATGVVLAVALAPAATGALAAPPLYLPWQAGVQHYTMQGPGQSPTHNRPQTMYATDFDMRSGETVLASAPATVYKTGTGCENRPVPSCGGGLGNYVLVSYETGVYVEYAHLSAVDVQVGQQVTQAQAIGKSGLSGESNGYEHIHTGLVDAQFISKPSSYADAGSPKRGDYVVSQNSGGPGPQQPRIAAINGCGALYTKDGASDAAFIRQLDCGDARAVALGGNRIAAINGCGSMVVKDGPPDASWLAELQCNDAQAVAVTQSRMALINACGALYTKDGPADAAWIRQLDCGDARAVALGGNRIAAINGCGAMVVKDGPPDAGWVPETQCNDAQAIAVTQTRMALINGCGAMFTKDGPADAASVRQLDCGDARAISLAGSSGAVAFPVPQPAAAPTDPNEPQVRASLTRTCKSAKLSLRRAGRRRLLRRGSFRSAGEAPFRGRLTIALRGRRRVLARGRRQFVTAGVQSVRVRVTPAGHRLLRKGSLRRAGLSCSFRPDGGPPVTVNVAARLRH